MGFVSWCLSWLQPNRCGRLVPSSRRVEEGEGRENLQEHNNENLQQRVNVLNREYIHAMNDSEGPEKETRLRRLREAINEYERRLKRMQNDPGTTAVHR